MALGLKEIDDIDSAHNVADQHARAREREQLEQQAIDDTFDKIPDNYDQDAGDDIPASEKIDKKEQEMNYQPDSNSSNRTVAKTSAKKLSVLLRKRYGVIGLITTFGVGSGLLISFFGPASMMVNIVQNFALKNDSSSVVMERRLYKVLGHSLAEGNMEVCGASNKIKCRLGRISNRTLTRFAKAGVVPMDGPGKPMPLKKTGLPAKNPTHYEIRTASGVKSVNGSELMKFLKQGGNEKLAGKVLGRYGAINMRVRAHNGKIYRKSFLNRFGLDKLGGIASKSLKSVTPKKRYDALKEKWPKPSQKAGEVGTRLKADINNRLGKASKIGNIAYLTSVGGCMLTKAPQYIAMGIAAVQLAQVLAVANDTVLSPSSKAQSAGLDMNDFSADDAENVGNKMTERTKRPKDGKLTAALDSQYLLTSLGLNKKKLPVSEFTPGYAAISSPLVSGANAVSNAVEPACNIIMSPTTMYLAIAASIALKAAQSATVIGIAVAVGEQAIAAAIGVIAGILIGELVGQAAQAAIVELAKNDKIPEAKGEAFGEIIGIAMPAFFSSASMSRGITGMTMSNLGDFRGMVNEQEEFQRRMDIASLSPFDTSSPYTFLGSILHNTRLGMLSSGSYNQSFLSTMTNLAKLPLTALSVSAKAGAIVEYDKNLCSYAKEFNLGGESEAETPAINMVGMPCTGFTKAQDKLTPSQALQNLESVGWIDTNVDIPSGTTLPELIEVGFVKKDNPLAEYIEDCTDASTGNYIFNSAGCIITGDRPGDDAALASVSPFLVDYQASLVLGDDDIDDGEGVAADSGADSDGGSGDAGGSSGGGDNTAGLPPSEGKIVSPIPDGVSARMAAGYGTYPTMSCTRNGVYYGPGKCPHLGLDFAGSGWSFRSICDGTIKQVDNNGDRNGAKTNYIWIQCDGSNIYTGYAHYYYSTIQPYVKVGARVTAGTPLAKVGNQGNSTGTHLHFQINPKSIGVGTYNSKNTINPACYLESQGVNVKKYGSPKGHRGC